MKILYSLHRETTYFSIQEPKQLTLLLSQNCDSICGIIKKIIEAVKRLFSCCFPKESNPIPSPPPALASRHVEHHIERPVPVPVIRREAAIIPPRAEQIEEAHQRDTLSRNHTILESVRGNSPQELFDQFLSSVADRDHLRRIENGTSSISSSFEMSLPFQFQEFMERRRNAENYQAFLDACRREYAHVENFEQIIQRHSLGNYENGSSECSQDAQNSLRFLFLHDIEQQNRECQRNRYAANYRAFLDSCRREYGHLENFENILQRYQRYSYVEGLIECTQGEQDAFRAALRYETRQQIEEQNRTYNHSVLEGIRQGNPSLFDRFLANARANREPFTLRLNHEIQRGETRLSQSEEQWIRERFLAFQRRENFAAFLHTYQTGDSLVYMRAFMLFQGQIGADRIRELETGTAECTEEERAAFLAIHQGVLEEVGRNATAYREFLQRHETENAPAYRLAHSQFCAAHRFDQQMQRFEAGTEAFDSETQQNFERLYQKAVNTLFWQDFNDRAPQTIREMTERSGAGFQVFLKVFQAEHTITETCSAPPLPRYTRAECEENHPDLAIFLRLYYDAKENLLGDQEMRRIIQEELAAYETPQAERSVRNRALLMELVSAYSRIIYSHSMDDLTANYPNFQTAFADGSIALSARLEREIRGVFALDPNPGLTRILDTVD